MKIKNMKRTVVSTALALTLTAGLTANAGAAWTRPCPENAKPCISVSTVCGSNWLQELLKKLGCQTPDTPVVPDTPVIPETPIVPEAPDTPDAPVVPETPDTPDEPVVPETPDTPDEPSAPEADNSVHAYEQKVAELVNAERAKHGLPALTLSAELCRGARAKSQDMAQNHYFSHTSPTYGSPFDMMKQFGITYRTAGENIAQGQTTPEAVVTAWMNSEGHRANILSTQYTSLGVGYVANGNYWTQWFIG